MYKLREQPFNTGGERGVRKMLGLECFWINDGVNIFQTLKGVEILFIPHWQSFLINVIKKGSFHLKKKKIEFGYIKYELGMGKNVYTLERGRIYFHMRRSCQPNFPPSPCQY